MSAAAHGHKLELRNQLFSGRRTETSTHSGLGGFDFLGVFLWFTSECVQSSLNAAAQKEELGRHGDQEAARRSVLIPK